MIYVIAYDRRPGLLRSNQAFLDEIRSLGPYWVNPMERLWLVYTTQSAVEIGQRLLPYMIGVDGKFFICPLGSGYYGYLPHDAWDWIAQIQQEFNLAR